MRGRLILPLLCALIAATPQAANAEDTLSVETIDRDPGWALEEFQFRVGVYDQRGKGFQSVASLQNEAGSEDTVIFQPLLRVKLRQSDRVNHEIVVPVDIISAASPNAVDAISSASAIQESAGLDIRSQVAVTDNQRVATRYGFSVEENLGSAFIGLDYERDLAQDNATLHLGTHFVYDYFNDYRRDGRRLPDRSERATFNANIAASQILSPTTIAFASYGFTYQQGQLSSSFNTAPITGGGRYKERFPNSRLRHAISATIAEHLPKSRSTLKASYRYYRDDFDINAHTARFEAYQYMGSRWLGHLSYRLYWQNRASFYADSFPRDLPIDQPRTSDSDLDRFFAHEIAAKISYALGNDFWTSSRIDLGYLRYQRTNHLHVDLVSFGYAVTF